MPTHWKRVTDCRPKPQIPTAVFPAAFFAMFVCRLGSFNALEQLRAKSCWQRWLGSRLPCADELAYVSERINTTDLRACQGHVYARLKRNKVLQPTRGWMLAAIDGHEINCSYRRCCEKCLQREIEVGGKKCIQYYHRLVAFQIICEGFNFLLDLELLRPGEDEPAAASRLLQRVLKNHPRCFDVLSADAIYLRPSMLQLLDSHGKYLVAVLKNNQPELLQEARALMAGQPAQSLEQKKTGQSKQIQLRDMEGFQTETISKALRVVWSAETTRRHQRVAGQRQVEETKSDWFWATNLPKSMAEAEAIADFGHLRWKIENEGFNELVTHWHADHYFHHHPNSIEALWLILFAAHAVFHSFYQRNLKTQARRGHTALHFARLLEATLREESWWPPPPG